MRYQRSTRHSENRSAAQLYYPCWESSGVHIRRARNRTRTRDERSRVERFSHYGVLNFTTDKYIYIYINIICMYIYITRIADTYQQG